MSMLKAMLGLDPDELVKDFREFMVKGLLVAKSIDDRLARIENKLGIEPPNTAPNYPTLTLDKDKFLNGR